MKNLKEYLLKSRYDKKIRLFFDIETLQYNEEKGRLKPSLYKNVTYSVAVSYIDDDVKVAIFPNFYELFEFIFLTYKQWKTVPKFELIAHNNNKYDNHFLRHDILYYYNQVKVKNLFLKNANEEGNRVAVKEKEIKEHEKEDGIILEKRIKSSNNLELVFFLNNIKFYTIDNWLKTNVSIATLGKKLLRIGVISEDELKTDYNYTKYNKDEDMTDDESREYAKEVFQNLDAKEKTYIRNDVIILAKSVLYYSNIFNGFDYDMITFTSNILSHYNNNETTNFQLLRKFKKIHLKYTDYQFNNENLYDWLKRFYSGGLNIYNTKYLGRIVEDCFSIDINSSYPYVMHHYKVPTFYRGSNEYEEGKKIRVFFNDDNKFTLYQMTKLKFDKEIIEKIESRLIKQILVKYYSKHDTININDWTLRLIENITDIKITELTVIATMTFDCKYFGSREEISEAYFIKTQGSQEKKIIYNDPYDIEITNEENDIQYSREEIDNSKVILNGLYGIPALRPYFNLFRLNEGELYNIENGYKNNERNIVFSTFVTAVALYNLLSPLKFFTHEEIDDNVIYMDTDSLYIRDRVRNKIDESIYHKYHLGKWDIDNDKISQIYVLNHKKYAYVVDGKIKVKAGGIVNESFDTNMDFIDFIDSQFSHGVEIKNTKSIYNQQGTISIYPSTTVLDLGLGYPVFSNDGYMDKLRDRIKKIAREEMIEGWEDVMYIESSIGTFSLSELTPVKNDIENKLPLIYLEFSEDNIRKELVDK